MNLHRSTATQTAPTPSRGHHNGSPSGAARALGVLKLLLSKARLRSDTTITCRERGQATRVDQHEEREMAGSGTRSGIDMQDASGHEDAQNIGSVRFNEDAWSGKAKLDLGRHEITQGSRKGALYRVPVILSDRRNLMRNSVFPLLMAGLFTLAGCGGGGSNTRPDDMSMALPPAPQSPIPEALPPEPPATPTAPAPVVTESTLQGFAQFELNELAYDPMVDLPRDGAYGLKVVRPEGLQAVLDVVYEPEVRDRWDTDTRLIIESGLRYAFKQWGRHFKGNPERTFQVTIGPVGHFARCPQADACALAYRHDLRTGMWYPAQMVDWFLEHWLSGDEVRRQRAAWVIVALMSHEAGHNAGYYRPGGPDGGGHAPDGSGSIMSYDWTTALVTSADIRRLGPQAEWRGQRPEHFEVSREERTDSIDSWGVWITRDLVLSETVSARGNGSLGGIDVMSVTPFVKGTASQNHRLRGNATWSGDFLGFDLDYQTMALLRADAGLHYVFDDERMTARFTDFEQHFAGGWSESSILDQSYVLDCTTGGCVYEKAGVSCLGGEATCGSVEVRTQWYAHEGDPSGYVAGVVNDDVEKYAGAFAAEKD